VFQTDASPANGGLTADLSDDVPIDARQTDVDLTHKSLTNAAQTDLDPISTNTTSTGVISFNTGIIMALRHPQTPWLKLRWKKVAIVDHGAGDQAI
jgi:hypothetical protein